MKNGKWLIDESKTTANYSSIPSVGSNQYGMTQSSLLKTYIIKNIPLHIISKSYQIPLFELKNEMPTLLRQNSLRKKKFMKKKRFIRNYAACFYLHKDLLIF